MDNVHHSEQHIDFRSDVRHIYYGWYLSGVDSEMSVHPFVKGEQEWFISMVTQTMRDQSRGPDDHERAAAYLAFARWGDSVEDREWGERCLHDHFEDYASAIERIEFHPGEGAAVAAQAWQRLVDARLAATKHAPTNSTSTPAEVRPYTIKVQWMAEAEVVVHAKDPHEAETIVRSRGLPWDQANEGDDGGATTFTVVEPASAPVIHPPPREVPATIPVPRSLTALGAPFEARYPRS